MDERPQTDVQVEIDVIAYVAHVWPLRERAEVEGQPWSVGYCGTHLAVLQPSRPPFDDMHMQWAADENLVNYDCYRRMNNASKRKVLSWLCSERPILYWCTSFFRSSVNPIILKKKEKKDKPIKHVPEVNDGLIHPSSLLKSRFHASRPVSPQSCPP